MRFLAYKLLKPLLFWLPTECSHHLTLKTLKLLHRLHLLPKSYNQSLTPITVMGIRFENPIGLAAGLDKNGEYIDALAQLGFGFIEVGTVTPKPQLGNPKPRLFRLPGYQALINRMGFNNKGVDYLINQIEKSQYKGPLGINIGKNATTPLESAVDDYLICMDKVYPYASYIVINISSPNTKNLRQLQHGDVFDLFIQRLKQQQEKLHKRYSRYIPLVIKVAPDLNEEEIRSIAECLLKNGIDGLIVSNTTCSRDAVKDHPLQAEQGGLSGAPLHDLSCQAIREFKKYLENRIPIIGVGGIQSDKNAEQTLAAGAQLIQLYTGLIYQGPGLISRILKTLTVPSSSLRA